MNTQMTLKLPQSLHDQTDHAEARLPIMVAKKPVAHRGGVNLCENRLPISGRRGGLPRNSERPKASGFTL